MPKPRFPRLRRDVSRHNKTRWYVRIGTGRRIRIHAEFGTDAFAAEYAAALTALSGEPKGKPRKGSLCSLWETYRASAAWASLSSATRRQRENIMRQVIETAGNEPFADVTPKAIRAGVERRKDTPSMGRHFVETLRGMFQWAVEHEIADIDPTRDIKTLKKSTDGHHTWTDSEIAAYEVRWPLGTRERLAFDILLYTGLRRGDAVTLGRQHVKNGVITLRTAKTGETVTLPVLPELAASIAAGPCGDLAFIAGDRGRPMTKEAFGNWFMRACRAAGSKGTAHGLRKAAATKAANSGATVAELEAWFGWRGGGMASLYTRKADRVRLAKSIGDRLTDERNSNKRDLTAGASDLTHKKA